MQPKDFVFKYLTAAKNCEGIKVIKNGVTLFVPKEVTLTQCAVESRWGDVAPGNNFFGIKSTTGLHDKDELLLTHEDLDNENYKFPKIVKIVKISQRLYRYTIYDYFRTYPTPEDSFKDHANFLLQNERYHTALALKDPVEVLKGIAAAGYAKNPDYAPLLVEVERMIKNYL